MAGTLLRLAWVFMKIGTFSFGGGIAIIPLVQTEVVTKYGWLTESQFVDAITLGQITPGPVVVSATFIGHQVAGIPGAIVATISVILPSLIMICLATRAVRRFKENKTLAGFFRGARIAVVGLIFQAAMGIGSSSIINFKTALIAGISTICLFRYDVNPIWILIGAGAIGLAI